VSEQNGRIHNQVVELLSAYMDGEVSADERALVETHLATCALCAHDLVTLRQTVSLLRQLPQVAAPRPFTLRETDVKPVRPARPAWWRLPWARGLAAATAMLACVVVVAGVVLLGRPGMLGAPAAPAPVALQAPAATEAPVVGMAAEQAVEAQPEAAASLEAPAAAPAPAEEKAAAEPTFAKAAELQATPTQPAPTALSMAQEAPPKAPAPEAEALADQAELPTPTARDRAAAGAQSLPTATPAPAVEAMNAVSPTLLLQVEALTLTVKPGVIGASGRLALPEGRKLAVELWRDGQLVEWAIPESQQALVGPAGQFSLELRARPGAPDFDLFAAPAANYELRLRPVDPPEAVEARIPFDTYGPPAAAPTNTP
jgi:anti-sigma factor RsiW